MRVFWDGAENPDGYSMWTSVTGVSIVTSPVRSGGRAYNLNYGDSMYKNFTAAAEMYFRIGWRCDYVSDAVKSIRFRKGTTDLITMGLDTTNQLLRVLVGGSVVATGTRKFQYNQYYSLEFHIKIDDAVGVIQMKMDGILDIDYSGDTKPGADTTMDNLFLSSNHNLSVGTHIYIDDVAINDTSGTDDNSWCGDARIAYLYANAAGDNTALTPSAGSNYACVDELTQDGDATYVEGDVLDDYDLYNLIASGLLSDSVIHRVRPVAVARDTVASGGKIKLGLKTNATEYFGDDISLGTTYASVEGTEYLLNPQTAAAWTVAELDALQVGVKVRGT